jgi:hypothetical protein
MNTITGEHIETGGTPAVLMRMAAEGQLSKLDLAMVLPSDKRQAFFDACAAIEKRHTEDCTATHDPCLESGCALEGGICLQPLIRAETEYNKACAAVWTDLMR